MVALLLFSMGSVFALYEGIHKLEEPEPLTSPLVAVGILVVAIGLETYSFRTAIVESRPLKGSGTWWQFIRQSKVPELPVVLLEDLGALIGLVLALFGVGLTIATDNPAFDALGTICIGLLLGVIAIILIIEMKSLLIGEGATGPVLDRIVAVPGGSRRHRACDPHPDPVHRTRGDAGRGEDRDGAADVGRGRGQRHRCRRGAGPGGGAGRAHDLP